MEWVAARARLIESMRQAAGRMDQERPGSEDETEPITRCEPLEEFRRRRRLFDSDAPPS